MFVCILAFCDFATGSPESRELLLQGHADMAAAHLREAIHRDPALKPTALLYLSAIEGERKNPESSRQYLEMLIREAPDSPIAKELRQKFK